MDDVGTGIVLGVVASVFVFCTVVANITRDSTLKTHCKEHGYWQMGQTRIKCSLETKE